MVIHCLSCGKGVSSLSHDCPYCRSEVSPRTLEMNGIEMKAKENFGSRFVSSVMQLVHR